MHAHTCAYVHAGEALPWDDAEAVAREPGLQGTEGDTQGMAGDMQGMEGETQGTEGDTQGMATKDGWLIPATRLPATEPERGP